MRRGVRLIGAVGAATLPLAALASLSWLLAGHVAAAFAAPVVTADGTPATATTPIAVPTIAAGSATSIAPAAPTLTGVTIATGLTCVTAIVGLLIAIITLRILLRGGYGPFLRALLFGTKRARGAQRDATADADGGLWDASHTLNYRPNSGADDNFYAPDAMDDAYAEPASSRRGSGARRSDRSNRSGASQRSRGGSGRRPPSSSRRNDGWD